MNKAQKQIIKEWRKGHNKYMEQKEKKTTPEIFKKLLTKSPHNTCDGCGETIRPDQWSENNFTLCIDCG